MHSLGHPSQDFSLDDWEISFIIIIIEKIYSLLYPSQLSSMELNASHQTIVRLDLIYAMHRIVLTGEALDK